jgi:hypothetical protein
MLVYGCLVAKVRGSGCSAVRKGSRRLESVETVRKSEGKEKEKRRKREGKEKEKRRKREGKEKKNSPFNCSLLASFFHSKAAGRVL